MLRSKATMLRSIAAMHRSIDVVAHKNAAASISAGTLEGILARPPTPPHRTEPCSEVGPPPLPRFRPGIEPHAGSQSPLAAPRPRAYAGGHALALAPAPLRPGLPASLRPPGAPARPSPAPPRRA